MMRKHVTWYGLVMTKRAYKCDVWNPYPLYQVYDALTHKIVFESSRDDEPSVTLQKISEYLETIDYVKCEECGNDLYSGTDRIEKRVVSGNGRVSIFKSRGTGCLHPELHICDKCLNTLG